MPTDRELQARNDRQKERVENSNLDAASCRYVSELSPSELMFEGARRYVVQHPGWIALGVFSAGFLLGWKLKPW